MRLWCRRQGKNKLNEQSRITKPQSKAKNHPNTRGCKVCDDLDDLVTATDKEDQEMMKFDKQWKLTGLLSEEDIKKSATRATSVADAIKSGKKKVSGLQSLFSLA